MVSAVGYAFLRQEKEVSKSRFYIPVIGIPSADFVLRGECVHAFSRMLGPNPDAALTFLDQVTLSPEASVILVDHNRLAADLTHLSDLVVGIIDHHKDEGLCLDAQPRTIEPVGSTCSLIALEWKRSGEIEECIASLLVSGILMDTINLDPQYGRTTPKDVEVIH